jgi:hypothetical protein
VDAWLAPFRRFWSAHGRCSRTPPRPHGSIDTGEKED